MGFGMSIKLAPGVRVRASSRGIRASAGPRIARVHVGAGRTTFSSGIGPFTSSTSVGVRTRPASSDRGGGIMIWLPSWNAYEPIFNERQDDQSAGHHDLRRAERAIDDPGLSPRALLLQRAPSSNTIQSLRLESQPPLPTTSQPEVTSPMDNALPPQPGLPQPQIQPAPRTPGSGRGSTASGIGAGCAGLVLAVLVLSLTGGLLSAAGYTEKKAGAAPTVTTTVVAAPVMPTTTITPSPVHAKSPRNATFVMPNFVGVNGAIAQSALAKAGIRADMIEMVPSDGRAFVFEPGNWTVTGQSIPPGQALANDKITLTLKKN
jgi:hypothetical protein